MQVVLLGDHVEVGEALRDGVGVDDVHPIVTAIIAGMGHPLPASHELVLSLVAKGVAHPAMTAGQAGAGANRAE